MHSPLNIREASSVDYAAIASIYNESIGAGDSTMDEEPKTGDDIAGVVVALSEREALLILESPSDVLGWGIIKRYSDRPGYRYACETSVYVRRLYAGRRLGYGSCLLNALLERCRQLEYHHIVARVWANNKLSIAFHEKFGFEVVGTQREIGFLNGRRQDVIIMQRILGAGA